MTGGARASKVLGKVAGGQGEPLRDKEGREGLLPFEEGYGLVYRGEALAKLDGCPAGNLEELSMDVAAVVFQHGRVCRRIAAGEVDLVRNLGLKLAQEGPGTLTREGRGSRWREIGGIGRDRYPGGKASRVRAILGCGKGREEKLDKLPETRAAKLASPLPQAKYPPIGCQEGKGGKGNKAQASGRPGGGQDRETKIQASPGAGDRGRRSRAQRGQVKAAGIVLAEGPERLKRGARRGMAGIEEVDKTGPARPD